MSDRNIERITLSAEGLRRKHAIERSLLARAGNRRLGRAVLGGGACIALVAVATIALRGFVAPTPIGTPIADHRTARPDPGPEPNPSPAPLAAAHIRVVTNEPLPDRPCPQGGSVSPSTAWVCLLSDAQLLSVLSQTGQSYGIVRVGGAVHVVSNSGSR